MLTLAFFVFYHYFSASYNHIFTSIKEQRTSFLEKLPKNKKVNFWVSRINPKSKKYLNKKTLLDNNFREITLREEYFRKKIPYIYKNIYLKKDKKYTYLISKKYYLDKDNNLKAKKIFLSSNIKDVVKYNSKELYEFIAKNKIALLKGSFNKILNFY